MGHRISARAAARNPDAGLTLLELLVATAVLAVLSVGATLSLGTRGGGTSDMARFAALYDTHAGLAVGDRARRGLRITQQDIQVHLWRDNRWQPLGRAQRWRRPVALNIQSAIAPGAPQVVFLANGQATAFSVVFEGGGQCTSDGWSELTCSDT